MDKNAAKKLSEFIKKDTSTLFVDDKHNYIRAIYNNLTYVFSSLHNDSTKIPTNFRLYAIYDSEKDMLHIADTEENVACFANAKSIHDECLEITENVCTYMIKEILQQQSDVEISEESINEVLSKIKNKSYKIIDRLNYINPIVTNEYFIDRNEYLNLRISHYVYHNTKNKLSIYLYNYTNLVGFYLDYNNEERKIGNAFLEEHLPIAHEFLKSVLLNMKVMDYIIDNNDEFMPIFKDREIYHSVKNLNCDEIELLFNVDRETLVVHYPRKQLLNNILTTSEIDEFDVKPRKEFKKFLNKHNLSKFYIDNITKITSKGECLYQDLAQINELKDKSKLKKSHNIFENNSR